MPIFVRSAPVIWLREMQHAFLDAVLQGDASAIAGQILSDGIAGERRVQIYRNNTQEGFIAALLATFPVIEQLSGSDWFRQTALQFQRCHPSRSGNLHYVGESFRNFLESQLAGTAYEYFADVARLEWAYQEVCVAADASPLDLAQLSCVEPESYDQLAFSTYPALRLVESSYPILAIWKAHQPQVEPAETAIDLSSGPSRVLVIRRSDGVELRELPVDQFALLDAFTRGLTLEAAAEEAMKCTPALDLGAALLRLAALETLTAFEIRPPNRRLR
jgi:hypothetical protein